MGQTRRGWFIHTPVRGRCGGCTVQSVGAFMNTFLSVVTPGGTPCVHPEGPTASFSRDLTASPPASFMSSWGHGPYSGQLACVLSRLAGRRVGLTCWPLSCWFWATQEGVGQRGAPWGRDQALGCHGFPDKTLHLSCRTFPFLT